MEVIVLVMTLWFANGTTDTVVKHQPDIQTCRTGEDAAHFAAKNSFDVIDVGTLCVKSEFDANIKARS
jgi:hypothetical protein